MISVICFLMILFLLYTRKKGGKPLPGRIGKVLILIGVFGIILTAKESLETGALFDGKVDRPQRGEADLTQEFSVTSGKRKAVVTAEIPARTLTPKEAEKELSKARREIDKTIAGENPSLGKVTKDLSLRESYRDGAVEAEWLSSDPERVDPDGTVHISDLKKKLRVTIEGELTAGKEKEKVTYEVTLHPLNVGTKEGFKAALEADLKEAEAKDPTSPVVSLPDKIRGRDVTWRPTKEYTGEKLSLMGLFALVLILITGKGQKIQKEKKRKELMEAEYPLILNTLYLYLGAGITAKGAFTRIAGDYEKRKRSAPSPAYDLIVETVREMKAGTGEEEAYRRMGIRSRSAPFRKLSLLLVQNIQKGGSELLNLLEGESEEMVRRSKNRIREEGEKISTKLLLPMMGLLGLIMAVLIFPAMQGMGVSI